MEQVFKIPKNKKNISFGIIMESLIFVLFSLFSHKNIKSLVHIIWDIEVYLFSLFCYANAYNFFSVL